MDNSSENVGFNDQQLNETREQYLEESDSEYELEDYAPQPQASGSNLKADRFLKSEK